MVGGGITGLAAAHRIVELTRELESPIEVKLLEACPRLGGTILTQEREGFLIEGGPDSFITQKPWALALCKRIGIDDALIPTNPDCRRTFVVRDGLLYPIPEGFLLLAPSRIWPFLTSGLFSWPCKLRMGLDLILPRKDHGSDGDESLASFVRRRFGQEALERVAQPMVSGIYTADPEELSLRATMPRFLEMESKYRSLILAMRRAGKGAARGKGADSGARYSLFVSFKHGMATLIDALAARLPASSVQTNAPVSRVVRDVSDWRIVLADGSSMNADGIVLACPSYVSATLLGDLDEGLSAELRAIRYASSATMTMAFRREQIAHRLDGFGFVMPAVEKRTLIAATFSSIKFAGRAPDGWVLARAFMGGALHPHVFEMGDQDLTAHVLEDLRSLIGLQGQPRFIAIHRWPQSMPQVPVGHLDRVQRIENQLRSWPGLAVAGNAYAGIGVPDCVQSGESAARRVLAQLG